MIEFRLDTRIEPGSFVELVNSGWTYSSYEGIAEHYNLQRWIRGRVPIENKIYKVLHIVDPLNGKFGRNFDKLIIESTDTHRLQYIIGDLGVQYHERPVTEDIELITKNKKEKPQVFFDVNALG